MNIDFILLANQVFVMIICLVSLFLQVIYEIPLPKAEQTFDCRRARAFLGKSYPIGSIALVR